MYNNYVEPESAILRPLLHYSFKRIVNTIVFLMTIRSSMIIQTTFQPQG